MITQRNFLKLAGLVILFLSVLLYASFSLASEPTKGIAMAYPQYQEDLSRVGDNIWFYDWGACPVGVTNCVPMSYTGADPNLPLDYSDYILFLNEPNGEVPFGYPVSVPDAVNLYMAGRVKYTNAKWVVGNVVFWGIWNDWLVQFKQLCTSTQGCVLPEAWGVHVYLASARGQETLWKDFTNQELSNLHQTLGGYFWVTEFADIYGNVFMDDTLLKIFNSYSWIKRWAYFTNRYPANDPLVPAGWTTQLFDWDTGEPTVLGEWYIHGLDYSYIPIIKKMAYPPP